ncbi:hypothetical protein GGR54DRAFT_603412 [Hypoxylon sp. NC1633]|nr:hypothetical protein GGR54DRAFT_603412 [Hypoxylon sp. NC1633]
MANLMRQSRPWLLSSLQPRVSHPILFTFCRAFGTTTPRLYASRGKPSGRSRISPPKSSLRKKGEMMQMEANMTLLIPNTLVAPPFWRYPRQPSKFVHMLWLHAKARAQSLWGVLSMKLMSQPTIILSKPLLKFGKSAAIPTAKALHIQMSEAMAAGDKETLRSICTPELFQTLASTIDSRPKGVRAEWELVRYDQTWRYPRLADWRVGFQPMHDGTSKAIKQVIVTIASVQRIARYDIPKGRVKIPGSERVRHMTEHIVMQATIDITTWENGPWKIWGTLPETTYENYVTELENLQALIDDQVGKT